MPALRIHRTALVPLLAVCMSAALGAQRPATYFPPKGEWKGARPADVGMDSAKLQAAVEFALANPATWDFERDQARTFGRPLGPLPKTRAGTNGIIIRHGYIVAQFGDVKASDPVYSVAKSFLSTVAGVAVDRGLIRNVNDSVFRYITDGGYDSPQNRGVTWKHHLQQTSEWEGTLWGKNADFVGVEEFGNGQRPPRARQAPGSFYEYNDVRINRFALSLLRLFRTGVPDVLKASIMDPIGASSDWRWVPYDNSQVEIDGRSIGSVSGGTRWGGGLWINSEDLARFGLLVLNKGKWENRQLVSPQWFADAVKPSDLGRDYGYLWWLNTQKRQWPSAPASSFAALGNGSNTIWIDPEHDIVFVWHWHRNAAMDPMIAKIMEAVVR
ncbi:MAG TPA: serine hydrolase [Gemmatimonadaceae bacterium]|nr:serine hydrolase [Gemmatimonadaceae bacterium]